MSNLTDEQLMKHFQDGKDEAFHSLFDRYKDKLFRYVHGAYLHDHQRSEDCVQEIFLRVIENRRRYDDGRKFSTWLYAIARNAALNMIRSHGRRAKWLTLDSGNGAQTYDVAVEDKVVSRRELREAVMDAVRDLPDNLGEVFVLREINNMPYEDVASLLGMTEGNVRTTVHRARKKLQKLLKPYLED